LKPKALVGDVAMALAAAVLLLGVMEAGVRLVQGGARPMIPAIRDERGQPRLPPEIDFDVRLSGGARSRLTTDAFGARVADQAAAQAPHEGGLLVVGDSQAMGWNMPFEQSFGARVAAGLGVPLQRTFLLTAAAQEPESLQSWLQSYTRAHPQRLRAALVSVNLGNDFEEMVYGRLGAQATPTPWHMRALTAHSLLFLDAALVRHLWGNRYGDELPPGVNVSMAALDADARRELVHAMADAVERLVASLPPADQVLVLGVAQDTQVAASEFAKYRRYYQDDAEFQKYRAMQQAAVARLAEADAELGRLLRARGISYLSLAEPLRAHWRPQDYLDTGSHHLLAAAHAVAADAIGRALQSAPAGAGPALASAAAEVRR
jgi:hypothetical protein